MAHYYFISQLPSLDALGDSSPLPITEERFLELCTAYLSAKQLAAVKKITLSPPKSAQKTGVSLIDDWYEGERSLRFALSYARALKLRRRSEKEAKDISPELLKAATEAVNAENPLKAEEYLNSKRLQMLEELRPSDGFSDSYIYYYALRLGLLSRMRRLDSAKGETAYRAIYEKIINKDGREAQQ